MTLSSRSAHSNSNPTKSFSSSRRRQPFSSTALNQVGPMMAAASNFGSLHRLFDYFAEIGTAGTESTSLKTRSRRKEVTSQSNTIRLFGTIISTIGDKNINDPYAPPASVLAGHSDTSHKSLIPVQ